MMNFNGASYTYDARDRLTQVSTDDEKNISYRYNGDGLLYERTENGVTTRYYYDGSNMIAEGTVSNGTVTLKASYERGNSLIARIDASGNKQYYLHNGHGDVVGLTDSAGNLLNQYSYDIWGNPITASEQVPQPFRYRGEYWDSSTGLQYLRARWYDPSIGRFINKDTYEGQIDNPLSLNPYTYVSNNPLTNVDPSGLAQEYYPGRMVGMMIDIARQGNVVSQSYWDIKSDLGQARGILGADLSRNQILFLFNLATMTVSKLSEGKTKRQAIVCIMSKLVNIVYKMLKYKTEYRMDVSEHQAG